MAQGNVSAPDPERVLVLAPTEADAALTRSLLAEGGLSARICVSMDAPP